MSTMEKSLEAIASGQVSQVVMTGVQNDAGDDTEQIAEGDGGSTLSVEQEIAVRKKPVSLG